MAVLMVKNIDLYVFVMRFSGTELPLVYKSGIETVAEERRDEVSLRTMRMTWLITNRMQSHP